MKRRVLLAAGLAAAAGCLAEPESAANDDGDGGENGEEGEDENGTDAPSTFEAALSLPSYVLSMNEHHPDEARPNQLTDLEEVNAAASDAVETAIDDGTYETDDADDELREGLFDLRYVERDGTIYAVEYELPEYVVSGRDVPESEVDPDRTISRMDDRIRVLGVDNREIVRAVNAVLEPGRGREEGGASGHEYRAPILDENLESFLEEYDYVVYPGDGDDEPEPEGYVELALDHEDPGAPYTVSVEELSDETRYGRPVTDVATYPDAAADALRTAADRRPLRTDDRPEEIDAALEDDALVRIDDGVYEPALERVDHDDVPVSLEITDVDEGDRSFTLAVEADGEEATLFGGAPEPFGVLGAVPEGDEGERDGRALLWSDAYEADGHVHVGERDGEPAISVDDIGITTRLEPGDPMAETFEARRKWGFESGEYRLESSLSVEWGGDLDGAGGEESSPFPFVVALSVPDLES